MMTWSAWPDDQRAATEVPRNSGHPPREAPSNAGAGFPWAKHPGDEDIELPYLYVGPHEAPPADALAFFREGRERVHDGRNQARSSS